MIKVNVKNEYGKLNTVLMASIKSFHLHPPINKTQEYYYKNDPPKMDIMIQEQLNFVSVLQNNGVEVVWAPMLSNCTNQINTRDVGFSIGNSFVISAMKENERKDEHLALEKVVENFDKTVPVYRPKAGVIEGGDIILDGNRIFVGISERTNKKGLEWLVSTFGDKFEIIEIELQKYFLHLDVVFNLLAGNYALVYSKGIKEESLVRLRALNYTIIETEPEEQGSLATNVFAINPNLVVCDSRNKKTNDKIRNIGKTVIEVDFSEISKIGGSFRCSTCPLNRED